MTLLGYGQKRGRLTDASDNRGQLSSYCLCETEAQASEVNRTRLLYFISEDERSDPKQTECPMVWTLPLMLACEVLILTAVLVKTDTKQSGVPTSKQRVSIGCELRYMQNNYVIHEKQNHFVLCERTDLCLLVLDNPLACMNGDWHAVKNGVEEIVKKRKIKGKNHKRLKWVVGSVGRPLFNMEVTKMEISGERAIKGWLGEIHNHVKLSV